MLCLALLLLTRSSCLRRKRAHNLFESIKVFDYEWFIYS